MEYAEEYFNKESREGFVVSSLMKRCWAAQQEVLEQFDQICKTFGLQYYLAYGSLLGAVRHSGFIPWDDDIDIMIPSKDLDRIIRDLSPEFQKAGLEVVTPFSDPQYTNLAYRVINTRDPRFDDEFLIKYHMFPYMAGIDLFPLSHVPQDPEDRELQKVFMISANILGQEWNDNEVPYEEKLDLYIQLTDMLGVKRVDNAHIENQLWRLTDRIAGMFDDEKSEEVAVISYLYSGRPRSYRKEWFGEPVYLSFEGREYPCPKEYIKVLKVEYGEDYMVPKIGTADHDYPYYKRYHDKFLADLAGRNIKCPDIYREL